VSKPFVLGEAVFLKGDVTQNRWVGARSGSEIERSLGFGAGRLSAGWTLLLLKQTLAPLDFEFSGLTIRSGGRFGLPADTADADKQRLRVSDEMRRTMGATDYEKLQRKTLSQIGQTFDQKGEMRLVKIIPAERHSPTMKPSEQYPMGAGGLQWTLIRDCKFLVAVTVSADGIARTPHFSVSLQDSTRYEDRARLAQYINEA
jgi:hypothetical protein